MQEYLAPGPTSGQTAAGYIGSIGYNPEGPRTQCRSTYAGVLSPSENKDSLDRNAVVSLLWHLDTQRGYKCAHGGSTGQP